MTKVHISWQRAGYKTPPLQTEQSFGITLMLTKINYKKGPGSTSSCTHTKITSAKTRRWWMAKRLFGANDLPGTHWHTREAHADPV